MSAQPEGTRLAGVRVAWQRLPLERTRRAVADALVARIATASTGDPVIVGRRCERCGATDHGRPVVTGAPILASVSYTADVVVVAVADACRVLALGIDAEHAAQTSPDGLRELITPGQRTSLRHWTRVEAVLKADGRGLSVEPGRVRVERTLSGVRGSITGDSVGTERGFGTERGVLGIRPRLLRVRGPRGIVISLAVASV